MEYNQNCIRDFKKVIPSFPPGSLGLPDCQESRLTEGQLNPQAHHSSEVLPRNPMGPY